MIEVAIQPGERLDQAIRRCLKIAENTGEPVHALFNGTPLECWPGDGEAETETNYWRERKRLRDRSRT